MGESKRFILLSTCSFKLLNDVSKALSDEYEIVKAIDGAQTIRAISDKSISLACAIIDLNQPNMNVFQILNLMKKSSVMKYIPVIMMAENIDEENAQKCLDGGAEDVVIVPVAASKIKFAVNRAIRNKMYIKELEEKISNSEAHNNNPDISADAEKTKDGSGFSNREDIDALQHEFANMIGTLAEFRNFSKNHIKRVREITRSLCDTLITFFPESKLGKDDVDCIADASCYHDVGKLLIPDDIILKPLKLTPSEFDMIKSHTTKGCEILDNLKEFQTEKMYHYSWEICRYHHERYDGKGYPEKLMGENIPLSAQIVSIADAFDALMTNTTYRKAIDFEKAYSMVLEGECGMFSPRITQCFKMNKDKIEEIAKQYADPYA
ncbi:MAG: HD domain-containing protein [Lachnospiraceae bacterium]|nr:HD domain-containing protein [Lachnospiraceae bacterium]